MKEDDPEIATAHNPKVLDGGIALLEKIRKIFTDSVPNEIRYCSGNRKIFHKSQQAAIFLPSFFLSVFLSVCGNVAILQFALL